MHIDVHVKLDLPLKMDLKMLKYEANKLQGNHLIYRTTTRSDLTSPMKDLIHAEVRHIPWLSPCVPVSFFRLKESYTEARAHIGASAN